MCVQWCGHNEDRWGHSGSWGGSPVGAAASWRRVLMYGSQGRVLILSNTEVHSQEWEWEKKITVITLIISKHSSSPTMASVSSSSIIHSSTTGWVDRVGGDRNTNVLFPFLSAQTSTQHQTHRHKRRGSFSGLHPEVYTVFHFRVFLRDPSAIQPSERAHILHFHIA